MIITSNILKINLASLKTKNLQLYSVLKKEIFNLLMIYYYICKNGHISAPQEVSVQTAKERENTFSAARS